MQCVTQANTIMIIKAINNLSDALSSVITIVGTKLSQRPADRKHPFGFGRVEYFSAIIIAVIVLSAGITSLIESVKKNAPIEARFEIKEAKNGKPFFNLKASNGQVIGSSQMYASERTMKMGIASVMKNAPEAPVVEELD